MKDFVNYAADTLMDSGTHGAPLEDIANPVGNDNGFYGTYGKRFLDILLVLFTIVVIAPVILVCATATALSGGKPFYGHKRVGANGREFSCWKIRSMVVDSDIRLASHLAENSSAREEWTATRKLKNDPRITRFGQFLRKSSLDELPQVLNVLKGEMSIVGPRPVVRDELALYGAKSRAYLEMRPGITGLWQISGRNDVTYQERVAFDQKYRETCSLKVDLAIILQTVKVVLRRTGH